MIGRDIVVDGVRMVSSLKGRVISAGMYGKLKTVSQMIGIIFIFFIFNQDIHSLVSDTDKIYYWCVQNLMMYFSLCFSLISGGIYLFKKNG
ncbi:hypothetical protein FACS189459_3220 [Bacilli bacterium]|nr:hypothetical protein FACS189459_3220 [Bacilli bacterium]